MFELNWNKCIILQCLYNIPYQRSLFCFNISVQKANCSNWIWKFIIKLIDVKILKRLQNGHMTKILFMPNHIRSDNKIYNEVLLF